VTVREFNGTSDRLATDVGAASGMTYGTWAAIVQFSDLSTFRGIAYAHDSGGSYKGAFGTTNFSRFSINDGSTDCNFPAFVLGTGVWYLCVVRKATGAGVTPRFSVYNFGTSAWTHGDGNAAINDFVAPGAGGTHQFAYQGGAASIFAGRVAARAHWSNVLPWTSDAAGDSAIEAAGLHTAAANWAANNPSVFHLFDQASNSDPVLDLSSGGTGDQVSIVGTTVITGDDPPGFVFSSAPTDLMQAVSSETARHMAAAASTPLRRSVSTEAARKLAPSATHVFGRAIESAVARAVDAAGAVAFRRALSTEVTRPFISSPAELFGRPVETGVARPLVAAGHHTFGRAVESDRARGFAGTNPPIRVYRHGVGVLPVQIGVVRHGAFVPITHWEVSGRGEG
jgi:hypothetical protein